MIFFFFGYPGIGKDYCAKRLSSLVNIPHLDADDFLTKQDQEKLIKGSFTKKDRLRKLKRIIINIKKNFPNQNLTIGDSLPDNLSRKLLVDSFGENIIFIHLHTLRAIHLKRLSERKNHFFTADLLRSWIKTHWQPINISYIPLNNSSKNMDRLDKKLLQIYQKVIV